MQRLRTSLALALTPLTGAAALHAADGFGRNATSGAVTTAAQLKQYVESATTYIIMNHRFVFTADW